MEIINDFSVSVRKALKEIDPNYESYKGLVICGTHNPHNTEEMIDLIRTARKEKIPALLICFGNQLGAIQWARDNGIPDATSEEFGQGTFVVKKRPELKVGIHKVGDRMESWWSYYEVAIDWDIPDNWVAVGYHPEYQSSAGKPHPLLLKFIQNAKEYTMVL